MKIRFSTILPSLILFFVGLLPAKLFGQVPDLVVIEQGVLSAQSRCQGPRKAQKVVQIPQASPHAYSHTDVQIIAQNGSRSHNTTYIESAQQVNIVAVADTHRECGCIGPICNKPGSNISIQYTVYAQKNACDPEPALPREDSVNFTEYQSALQLLNRAKVCRKAVLEIKKKNVAELLKSTLWAKVSAKHGERVALQAEQLSKVQVFKSRIEAFQQEIQALNPKVMELAERLASARREFQNGVDFSSKALEISIQVENLKSIKEDQARFEKTISRYPGLRDLIKYRQHAGLQTPTPPPSLPDSHFSVSAWVERLQAHTESFKESHALLVRQLEQIQTRIDSDLKDSKSLFPVTSLDEELGISFIRDLVSQYESKSLEIYKKAVDNQTALQKLHDLNAESIDEWLCTSGTSVKHCQKPAIPLPDFLESFTKLSYYSANRFADQSVCLTLEFAASSSSEMTPIPERDGINFVDVNGRPLPFKVDKNSIERSNNKIIRSRSIGCFSAHILKMRSNHISLKYRYGDGSNMIGSSEAVLYANYGSANQKVICRESRTGSTQGSRQCQGQLVLDLRDLNPDLHGRISQLQNETRQLELEIRLGTQDLALLNQRLAVFAKTDLDKVSPDDIRLISSDLDEVATMLEDLRFRAELDKEQVYGEIAQLFTKQNGPSLESALKDSYDLNNDQILGPVILPDLELTATLINAHKLGSIQDSVESEVKSAYQKIYQDITRELQKSVDSNDFKKADAVLKSWKATRIEMLRRLQDRKAGAKELDLYRKLAVDVNTFIERYFDENGFSVAAKVPEDIKAAIAAAGTKFADDIRMAMNKYRQDHLDADQKVNQINFYMMMRAYDDLMKFSSQVDRSNLSPKAREEVEKGLLAMAESGFRLGVTFTPAGKFVDFCELVTGRTLCSPQGAELTTTDRAFAGLGIFIGSGALIRGIVKSPFIKEAKAISYLMNGFTNLIENNKGYFKADGENLTDVGRRLIRFVSPQVGKETAQEVVARSEKVLMEYLRDFKSFTFLDPAVQNRLLKDERFYRLPAWDIKYGIVKGTSASEKTFVRFFSSEKSGGSWMIPEEVVKGLTPAQIAETLALESVPTRYVKVVVPAGEDIYMGRISPNAFGGVREAVQFFVKRTKPNYFREVQELDEIFRGL